MDINEFKRELSKVSGIDFFNPKYREVFKKHFPAEKDAGEESIKDMGGVDEEEITAKEEDIDKAEDEREIDKIEEDKAGTPDKREAKSEEKRFNNDNAAEKQAANERAKAALKQRQTVSNTVNQKQRLMTMRRR